MKSLSRTAAVLLALLGPFSCYRAIEANDFARVREVQVLDRLNVRLKQAQAARRTLAQFHEEAKRLDAEQGKLAAQLPVAILPAEMRKRITVAAAQSKLRIIGIDELPPLVNPPLRFQYFVVEVVGPLDATENFLATIERGEPVANLRRITVRNEPEGWRTECEIVTYALPEDARMANGA